jgi:hypothetical protein
MGSSDAAYDMFPCPHDDCHRLHDFWISFEIRHDRSDDLFRAISVGTRWKDVDGWGVRVK